jgi:hypothetical protein
MHRSLRRSRALALALLVCACGGDDDGDGTDGPPADAALGADASEVLPDGGDGTACGEDAVVYCDRASQICVERDLGGGIVFDCVALPDGCDLTRDCASCAEACEEPADTCADTGDDNTLSCACLECR